MGARASAHRVATSSEIGTEALLSAVIEMSDDAIFTCDALGRVTTWSVTAERLFGRPATDVLEGPLDGLFPEHLRHEVQVVIATLLAGDRLKHFETEVLRPDGMPMPVSLSMCPIFDAGAAPVGSVVIARDVTEQRLTQATLAEVEARLEEGEALAHVGSWLWDLRTGAVQWSAEFHRIHGVDPRDFDGTFESYLGLIHPADRDSVRSAMGRSLASGRPFEGEYRVVRSDEEVRVVHVRAQPTIGSAGTAVGLRGIGQDVTDRAGAEVSRDRQES
jgi:PAS domain S-box-containing protein